MQTRRGKGLSAESEEKREPASDIYTGMVDSLKVLDPDGRKQATQPGFAPRRRNRNLILEQTHMANAAMSAAPSIHQT